MSASGLLWAGSSAAETPPTPDQRPIIVTADRRPERAKDVPISLTALSWQDLDRRQAIATTDLGRIVPSLMMSRTGAFTQPYLRGIGKRSTLGVENSVATYVDGVYFASPVSALLDLGGVERVEVLNGPQGTLFGRNTTGGVIQIVTREPSSNESAQTELSVGSYGYVRADAYLTGGSSRIAGNLAVSLSHNGGYGRNIFTGDKVQGKVDHSLAARSKWTWQPTDRLKLTFAGDYQDLDYNFMQLPLEGFPPIGAPRIQTFRDGDQNVPADYRFRYGGGSLRTEAAFARATFVSISAIRRMHERNSVDLDMGPLALVAAAVPSADQNQVSQEFQLQSPSDSKLRWLAGLYYIHISERYDPTTFSYGGSYSAAIGARTTQTLFAKGSADSFAGYGQTTIPVDRVTALTLGLRYTIEHRAVRANGQRTFDTAPLIRPIPGLPLLSDEPFRSGKTFRELTWRASLDRHFSDELMGYVSASRGFQSGGWNLQTPQNPPFAPETLDDYEIGAKYAEPGQRLSADANIFLYHYANLQVSAITPIGNATVNAASAQDYGLELQLEARPADRTRLSIGAQFLRARFNRFPNATCTNYDPGASTPYPPVSCDVSGNRLPFAPRFKFNTAGSQVFSLGRTGTLLLSANLAYNSGYFSEQDNVVRQSAFTTVDAFLEWRPTAGAFSVRLWGRNLTDAHYSNSLVTFPTAGILQSPAAPRRVGLSVGYSI